MTYGTRSTWLAFNVEAMGGYMLTDARHAPVLL